MQSEVNLNKNLKTAIQLDESIKDILKKEGYITYNVEKKTMSSDGGGYMGTLLAIDVKGKTKEGDKETNIFVKQIIDTDNIKILDVVNIYKRERFVYTDLINEIYDLQDKENIPHNERFKIAKVFNEGNDEVIILENLTKKGFKTYYRMDVMNLDYAELAVKELARLHGISLAIQKKRPDYFERKIKSMDCVYIFDEYFYGFTHSMRMFATQYLPEELREKLTPSFINIVDRYPLYMNDRSCIKTICHGDFRQNNIMVKEIDGKPTDVMAVDFQITFFGNPVLDFIYFIFWGTDQEFRKNHLDQLKQLYYNHLAKFLSYLSMQIEEVFPKEEFEKQYKEKLDFGLMISILFLPFMFPKEEKVSEMRERKEPVNDLKLDDRFGDRFRGIVEDFIKWGYL